MFSSLGIINPFQNTVNPSLTEEEQLITRLNDGQKIRYKNYKKRNFYLLDIEKLPDSFKIVVSGSTSNIYEVNINESTRQIKCNCPDGKGYCHNHNTICKHSYFILFKVLKLWELEIRIILF